MAAANHRWGKSLPRALRVRPAILIAGVLAALAAPLISNHINYPWFGSEFRYDLYGAGKDIVHGADPYNPGYVAHQAAVKRAGGKPETRFILPVYPAPALLAAVPFSLLPFHLAAILYLLIAILSLLIALRLLDVTDWRCYAVMFVSVPVLQALIVGALTPLLVLGTALAWRYRARVGPLAAAVGSVIAAKLLLWPLLGWMLVTRRLRALCLSLVLAAAAIVIGWAVIGFAGMTGYPHMLSNLTYVEQGVGVSLVALLLAVGLSATAAHAVAIVGAVVILGAAWVAARRPGGARTAFGLAVIAALVASPIAWPNYLALVFVPIALASPRLSAVWFVPLLAYLAPGTQTAGHLLQMLPYLAVELILCVSLLAGTRSSRLDSPAVGVDPSVVGV